MIKNYEFHCCLLFQLPSSVWLAGFFNPQSLLTAIMQSTARRQELPLDKMCLQCDVTKKNKEEFTYVQLNLVFNRYLFHSIISISVQRPGMARTFMGYLWRVHDGTRRLAL